MPYMNNIKSFVENQVVYCGMDVHKNHWILCYIAYGEVLEKIKIESDFTLLIQHTKRLYDRARLVHFVYEAGFSGNWLFRKLTEHGYKCTITPPNRVPTENDKVKTDKRDAVKLAKYLAGGLLKKVIVPRSSIEADRQILRLRDGYQKKCTRVKNQIKSHLNLYGKKWPKEYGNKWTKRFFAWLNELDFENENLRLVLDTYIDEYHYTREKIVSLTRKLRDLSRKSNYQKNYALLINCKGIGLITAMTFLLELHDIVRFPSAKQFSSYLGLTPSQHSSGEHVRLGHISREGNSHLRRVLVESAWTVIRHDPFLNEKYNRIRAKGTNGKKAIVAVARSLAMRLRRCILDETPYVTGVC